MAKAKPPQVPAVVNTAVSLAEEIAAIEVTDDAGVERATEVLGQLKAAHDEAERARSFLVRPLNDHVRDINATFKPKTDVLKAAIAQLKNKVASFHTQRQLEERAAAKAAAEFAGVSPEVTELVAQVETPTRATTDSGVTSTVTKRWDYEVTSIQSLAAFAASGSPVPGTTVPSTDLITIDRGALRRAVNQGARSIPGVRIFQETGVQIR